MSQQKLDNMALIAKDDHFSVTSTNCAAACNLFQSYTITLQNKIPPATITTTPPPTIPNVWKQHFNATLNLTDDKYCALDTPKKQQLDDMILTDTSANFETANTLSLLLTDLDRPKNSHHLLKCMALQQHINKL